jgi:hypothetical protein
VLLVVGFPAIRTAQRFRGLKTRRITRRHFPAERPRLD